MTRSALRLGLGALLAFSFIAPAVASTPAPTRVHVQITKYRVGSRHANASAIGVDKPHHQVYFADAAGDYLGHDSIAILNTTSGRIRQHLLGTPAFPHLSGPFAIAIDPVRGAAIIAAQGADQVYIANAGGIVKTFALPAGATPSAVYVDPVAHVAYVAEAGRARVLMIKDRKRVGVISVGDGPSAIAADPRSGLIYVANFGSNTVSVIRGGAVVATVPVGTGPSAVAVNPRTHRAYVTDETSAEVTILHHGTLETTLTFPTGTRPASVAVAPAVDVAYVALMGVFGDDDTCAQAAAAVIVGTRLSQLHPVLENEDCLGNVIVDRTTSAALFVDVYTTNYSFFLRRNHEITPRNFPDDIGFGAGFDVPGSRQMWMTGSDGRTYRIQDPFR